MTPIILQARMMQNTVAFWQTAAIIQKQWLEAVFLPGRLLTVPTAEATTPAEEPPATPLRRAARA